MGRWRRERERALLILLCCLGLLLLWLRAHLDSAEPSLPVSEPCLASQGCYQISP